MRVNRIWHRLLLLCALVVVILAVSLAAVGPTGAQASPTCFTTTELVDGQGFSASGLGFSASGLGFSVSGLGFSASGLGFSASGLGVTEEQLVQEIVDPANRIDSESIVKLLDDIEGGVGFGETHVALVIVDDFGGADLDSPPASDDPHGKKVVDVARLGIDRLVADGVISDTTIEIVPVNINDGTVDFQVDLILPRLTSTINTLLESGVTHIVINLSIGVWPCDDTVMLSDDTEVNFDFGTILADVKAMPDNDPTKVNNYLECISDFGDGRLIAHFGYENLNGSPIVIPPGEGNMLSGGGLGEAALEALTPFYFARPNVVEDHPGRSAPFPNSAFQVPFDPDHPLTWSLYGKSVTASSESDHCLVPEGYGFNQYFSEKLGLDEDQIAELLHKLTTKGTEMNPLSGLRTYLGELLDRSRTEEGVAIIPVAAAGNSRYLFDQGSPAPPFSPASMEETIAVGAHLGDSTPPELWRVAQDGNVALPGGTYELSPDNYYIGTSFATPLQSLVAALWLTYPDACTFEDNNRPPLNLEVAGDFVNAPYVVGGLTYPLSCERQVIQEVEIDIRPGNDFNQINLGSQEKVPVAVLSSEDFDARTIDVETVTLAGAPAVSDKDGWPKAHHKDVNDDGLIDILLFFRTPEMDLTVDDTEATLIGFTYEDVQVVGTDNVTIIPQSGPHLWKPYDGSQTYSSRPTLYWFPVPYAACYLVQVDNNADFSSPEQEATVVFRTYYRTERLSKGQYFWRVQEGGECWGVTPGPWSEVWNFTIK